MSTGPQGCLAAILALFGIRLGDARKPFGHQLGDSRHHSRNQRDTFSVQPSKLDDRSDQLDESSSQQGNVELLYRLRDDFLSPAELSFYRVLMKTVGNQVVVLVIGRLKETSARRFKGDQLD